VVLEVFSLHARDLVYFTFRYVRRKGF